MSLMPSINNNNNSNDIISNESISKYNLYGRITQWYKNRNDQSEIAQDRIAVMEQRLNMLRGQRKADELMKEARKAKLTQQKKHNEPIDDIELVEPADIGPSKMLVRQRSKQRIVSEKIAVLLPKVNCMDGLIYEGRRTRLALLLKMFTVVQVPCVLGIIFGFTNDFNDMVEGFLASTELLMSGLLVRAGYVYSPMYISRLELSDNGKVVNVHRTPYFALSSTMESYRLHDEKISSNRSAPFVRSVFNYYICEHGYYGTMGKLRKTFAFIDTSLIWREERLHRLSKTRNDLEPEKVTHGPLLEVQCLKGERRAVDTSSIIYNTDGVARVLNSTWKPLSVTH